MEINSLLLENRSLGFVSLEDSVKNIPAHILARLLEIRGARTAGKSAPAASRGYIDAAEKRNLSLPQSRRSAAEKFHALVAQHRAAFRDVPRGMSLEAHLEAVELRNLRSRARTQAVVIATAAPKTHFAQTPEQVEETRYSIFPVNF